MHASVKNTLLATAGAAAALAGSSVVASADSITVKSGDTLYALAAANHVSVDDLVSANKIADANMIHVGQKIELSSSSAAPAKQETKQVSNNGSYTVKAGDSLWAIANANGMTLSELLNANPDLQASSVIYVGSQINLSKSAVKSTVAVKPAASQADATVAQSAATSEANAKAAAASSAAAASEANAKAVAAQSSATSEANAKAAAASSAAVAAENAKTVAAQSSATSEANAKAAAASSAAVAAENAKTVAAQSAATSEANAKAAAAAQSAATSEANAKAAAQSAAATSEANAKAAAAAQSAATSEANAKAAAQSAAAQSSAAAASQAAASQAAASQATAQPQHVATTAPATPAKPTSVASANIAGNTYPYGQCTWYVKGDLSWVGNNWGNASSWASSATAAGHTVNGTASVGAVAYFAPGVGGASGYGHVAVVDSVNSDGTVTISEANYAGKLYNSRTISASTASGYIHQ